jgi:hypothetical protein
LRSHRELITVQGTGHAATGPAYLVRKNCDDA